MNFRNQVIMTGNLGADPVFVKKERNGDAIVRLSLACSEYRLNAETKSYEQSHTSWIPVVVFSRLATRAGENLKKGDLVTVYGKLRSNSFEHKGVKQTKLEVIASDLTVTEVLPKSAKEAMENLKTGLSEFSAENFEISKQVEESLEQ